MDADLEKLLRQELSMQAAGPPVAASTAASYQEKLRAWWWPYAVTLGLPNDFRAPGARALTVGELMALIGAAHTGDLRQLTRDGTSTRKGFPLSPSSLDGLFAALQRAHASAGLDWTGTASEVADARAAYRSVHGHAPTRAVAMAADHIVALFSEPPRTAPDPLTVAPRIRSIAMGLRLPLHELPGLNPNMVAVAPEGARVTFPTRSAYVECLRSVVDDVAAEAACAHCALRDWTLHYNELGPLVSAEDIRKLRPALARWLRYVPGARLQDDVLTNSTDDPWTAFAVGLPPAGQAWVRARAVLLPMRVAGLRLDDLDRLTPADVRVTDANVTLSIVGKSESAGRTHGITLEATGDEMCPVNAIRTYEAWLRAHGCTPNRPRWIAPIRGKNPHQSPQDADVADGSRALYQQIRLWLEEQTAELVNDEPNSRAHLTPHSARRGFAVQAYQDHHDPKDVQKAMRHRKYSTTSRYFAVQPDHGAAVRLLDGIAKDRNDAK